VSISKEQLAKYAYNDLFIETGTNEGRCVGIALELGFKHIVTIENNAKLFDEAVKKFKDKKNVQLAYGDSAKMLNLILKFNRKPATIYLDAHKKSENSQLFAELEQIKKYYTRGSVLLIDDMHDLFSDGDNKKLISKILEIDPQFRIDLIDGISANNGTVKPNDILVAEVRYG